MIRVVIADDQRVVRAGLAVILGEAPDIEVVGEAADGVEAVEAVQRLHPDVVIMDVRMPRLDGIGATRRITDSGSTGVLVVTTFDVDDYVFGAVEAGAAGFLLKGAEEDELLAAVRSVAAGEGTLDQQVTRRVLTEFARRRRASPAIVAHDPVVQVELTPREREILTLLAAGRSNREIASELFIEDTTVKYHVAGILTKLGVRDRLQAVIHAFRTGLVAV